MKVKRRQHESSRLLFKRMPSPMRHKLWLKTLASKKKFLTGKFNSSWTTVSNICSSSDSRENSSEDETSDSRALVVELPQRINDQTPPFFDNPENSAFLSETTTNRSLDESRIASTSQAGFGSDSDDTDDTDCAREEDTLEETQLTLLDSSRDDLEIIEEDDVEDKVYVFEEKDFVVAILRHPLEIILCGQALVQSISGTVSIFGCRLDSNSPGPVHVFSSYNFSFLTLRTEEPEKNMETAAYSKYIKYQLGQIGAKNLVRQVLSALDQNSVVVALRRAPEIGSVQYACHMTSKMFGTPPSRSVFAQPDFKKFGFTLAINGACKKWLLKKDQEELADSIVKHALYAQSFGSMAPRVVVCGGKNVGKSTFLRFLINKTLNVCDKVFHLEGDPGQTEFVPAGSVSLTQVNEPLLGPAFTHSRTPERMCYVGGITVENTPDLYSASIQQLISYHRNHLANHPLFINTMGWTTGLGLSLLVDILRAAQPTVIVQFDCGPSQASHNLPRLDTDFLRNACGWNSSREMLNVTEPELRVLSPPDHQRKLAECVMPAFSLRNLAIFSYMGQLQKPYMEFQPINSFTPYSVPWSSVAVHCCHEEVPPEQVMFAVNGSFVALCHVDVAKMNDSVIPDYPKCLSENPENTCYGFGLVRGIDFRKKLFLVITPEMLATLQEVNAFLIGSGKTPDQFFTTQDVEGRIPFVSETTSITSTGLTSPSKDRVYRERTKPRVAVTSF